MTDLERACSLKKVQQYPVLYLYNTRLANESGVEAEAINSTLFCFTELSHI
jgi:hypothetical protein